MMSQTVKCMSVQSVARDHELLLALRQDLQSFPRAVQCVTMAFSYLSASSSSQFGGTPCPDDDISRNSHHPVSICIDILPENS